MALHTRRISTVNTQTAGLHELLRPPPAPAAAAAAGAAAGAAAPKVLHALVADMSLSVCYRQNHTYSSEQLASDDNTNGQHDVTVMLKMTVI